MPPTPRIKICGITNVEDARRAADLGAWAIGLIFYPRSPRRVDSEVAPEVAAAVGRRVEIAGVFVDAPLDEVSRRADELGLTLLQLHGDEGPAYCAEVARRTGCRVIKAARVRAAGDITALQRFHTDFHLLDGHSPGLPGGTGQAFDWTLLRARRTDVPVILSGGLEAGNVGEAIAAARPFAVDVASGVEAEPGRKDAAKLEAFFAAARAGAAEVDAREARKRRPALGQVAAVGVEEARAERGEQPGEPAVGVQTERHAAGPERLEHVARGRVERQRERVGVEHVAEAGEAVDPGARGLVDRADRAAVVVDHDDRAVRPLGQQVQRVRDRVVGPSGKSCAGC
jgi:phosphoribosylanthranilate isomerase